LYSRAGTDFALAVDQEAAQALATATVDDDNSADEQSDSSSTTQQQQSTQQQQQQQSDKNADKRRWNELSAGFVAEFVREGGGNGAAANAMVDAVVGRRVKSDDDDDYDNGDDIMEQSKIDDVAEKSSAPAPSIDRKPSHRDIKQPNVAKVR
jgi:hypothetical protein